MAKAKVNYSPPKLWKKNIRKLMEDFLVPMHKVENIISRTENECHGNNEEMYSYA